MGVHVSPRPEPLPPSCPSHPSGLSQCTGFECPTLCIELGLVIYFTYGNIYVSMLFFQIIPSWPSPTESKSLFFISVSLLLSCIKGFPCGSAGKESTCSAGDLGSISGLGGSSGEGHGTPLLPGEFHGQRCLVGFSPWDHKESDTTG